MHRGIYLNVGRAVSSSKTPQGGKIASDPDSNMLLCMYHWLIVSKEKPHRESNDKRMVHIRVFGAQRHVLVNFYRFCNHGVIEELPFKGNWQLGIIYARWNIGGKRIRKGASMHIWQLPNVCHLYWSPFFFQRPSFNLGIFTHEDMVYSELRDIERRMVHIHAFRAQRCVLVNFYRFYKHGVIEEYLWKVTTNLAWFMSDEIGKRIRKGASPHIWQLPNICHLYWSPFFFWQPSFNLGIFTCEEIPGGENKERCGFTHWAVIID